jgi:hypothetical protein
MLVYELEGTPDQWLSGSLVRLGYPFALHTRFLEVKVPYETTASGDKKEAGFPRERLLLVSFVTRVCMAGTF